MITSIIPSINIKHIAVVKTLSVFCAHDLKLPDVLFLTDIKYFFTDVILAGLAKVKGFVFAMFEPEAQHLKSFLAYCKDRKLVAHLKKERLGSIRARL